MFAHFYKASETGRFTPRRLDERRRGKPGGKPTSRQAALHSLSDGVVFDVAVVGGSLEAATNAMQLASRGLKVAIFTSDDFDSGSWSGFGGRQVVASGESGGESKSFESGGESSGGREWRLLDTAPHLVSVGKLVLVPPPSLASLLLLYLTTRWIIFHLILTNNKMIRVEELLQVVPPPRAARLVWPEELEQRFPWLAGQQPGAVEVSLDNQ